MRRYEIHRIRQGCYAIFDRLELRQLEGFHSIKAVAKDRVGRLNVISYLRNHFAINRDLTISVQYKKTTHQQFNVFNPINGGLADVTLSKFYYNEDYYYAGYCIENQCLYIVENILS